MAQNVVKGAQQLTLGFKHCHCTPPDVEVSEEMRHFHSPVTSRDHRR